MHAAWIDLATVTAGYLLVLIGAQLLDLPYPGAMAVLAGVLAATWRLARNAQSWRSVGLAKPQALGGLILAVLALYVLTVVGTLAIIQPLSILLKWPGLDIAAYSRVQGNPVELAKILAIVWTTAAIGEELLFRGFLQDRIHTVLGSGRRSAVAVVLLQAAIFGVAHSYLGLRGIITAMLVGVIFGTWFLLRGRNLWPLILAHGLIDTITMTALYAGVMPQ